MPESVTYIIHTVLKRMTVRIDVVQNGNKIDYWPIIISLFIIHQLGLSFNHFILVDFVVIFFPSISQQIIDSRNRARERICRYNSVQNNELGITILVRFLPY